MIPNGSMPHQPGGQQSPEVIWSSHTEGHKSSRQSARLHLPGCPGLRQVGFAATWPDKRPDKRATRRERLPSGAGLMDYSPQNALASSTVGPPHPNPPVPCAQHILTPTFSLILKPLTV